jgi:predicted outer membrane repeat protein
LKRILAALLCISLSLIVAPGAGHARNWYVEEDGGGDAPTIQAAIDSASAGDDVVVAAGTYTWTNQGASGDFGLILFARDVTGIDLISESGPTVTILDAEGMGRVMYFEAYTTNTVEGFTITGGDAPLFGDYAGGGMALHLNYSTFRNCIISGNNGDQGGGVWVGGVCTSQFEDCTFKWNTAAFGAGAFLVNSSELVSFDRCVFFANTATNKGGAVAAYNHWFSFDNCTFYSNSAINKGGGLYCDNIWPSTVANCTFALNSADLGSGIHLFNNATLYANNLIVSYGSPGAGLNTEVNSQFFLGCSDIFGNAGGNGLPPNTIGSANFFMNPEFCGSVGSHYYHLQSDSPCAPGNHPDEDPCGLIGAHPVSCSIVPTKESTWGEIKAIYKN